METRQKQWLEIIGTYQWVISFLFMGPIFSLLLLFLLFTPLWSLSVLYLVWFFLDWDTPNQGGRRFEFTRDWSIWKQLRDYYPIKLVKTAELPPDRKYVLAAHPHEIMCMGAFCNICTEANDFSKHFPGIWALFAVLHTLFYLPVYGDYIMSLGGCSVNWRRLDLVLSQPSSGQVVVIVVGGAQEALYTNAGEHQLILRNHKGFVCLALRHG
ncbi:2-acylglycerol O-acyltransferase 3-like [Crocuta crocuta]